MVVASCQVSSWGAWCAARVTALHTQLDEAGQLEMRELSRLTAVGRSATEIERQMRGDNVGRMGANGQLTTPQHLNADGINCQASNAWMVLVGLLGSGSQPALAAPARLWSLPCGVASCQTRQLIRLAAMLHATRHSIKPRRPASGKAPASKACLLAWARSSQTGRLT